MHTVLFAVALVLSLTSGTEFRATHYGESFNGQPMYCGGTYSSADKTIVALGPAYYSSLPCGTQLTIEGPAGSMDAVVQDRCGGCTNQIDLSEAGIIEVCGGLGGCTVKASTVVAKRIEAGSAQKGNNLSPNAEVCLSSDSVSSSKPLDYRRTPGVE